LFFKVDEISFLFIENQDIYMNLQKTFLLSAGGLFDFDLTFVAEGILFLLLAIFVTFVFLGPVSEQINKRAELINFTLRKSTILLTLGYEKLSGCVELLTQEVFELNRQIKLTKTYTNQNFQTEIDLIQKQNSQLLIQLKGTLTINSAYLLSNISTDLFSVTDTFFNKKFKSLS
jgi:hypothetical protein